VRSFFLSIGSAAVLCLFSCAQDTSPLPAHPTIEGEWESVSLADIRTALDLVQKEVIRAYHSPRPIFRVRVVDRNHIEVCYYHAWPARDPYACQVVIRGKYGWALPELERAIMTGRNIPTT
jgi:hypothetical protein